MVYLIVFAEAILRLLLTDQWLPAVLYFQILCAAAIFYPHSLYSLNILAAKGRSDLHLKIEIYKKITSLVGLIVFMYIYGMIGLIIASALSMFIHFIFNSYICGKLLNYSIIKQVLAFIPVLLLTFFV